MRCRMSSTCSGSPLACLRPRTRCSRSCKDLFMTSVMVSPVSLASSRANCSVSAFLMLIGTCFASPFEVHTAHRSPVICVFCIPDGFTGPSAAIADSDLVGRNPSSLSSPNLPLRRSSLTCLVERFYPFIQILYIPSHLKRDDFDEVVGVLPALRLGYRSACDLRSR